MTVRDKMKRAEHPRGTTTTDNTCDRCKGLHAPTRCILTLVKARQNSLSSRVLATAAIASLYEVTPEKPDITPRL